MDNEDKLKIEEEDRSYGVVYHEADEYFWPVIIGAGCICLILAYFLIKSIAENPN